MTQAISAHQENPYYERWRSKLISFLDGRRGRAAEIAARYAIEHNMTGKERQIQVYVAKIKRGEITAGGETVCFLNEWMDGRCGK